MGSTLEAPISQALPAVVFVVTARNCAALLDRCLASIAEQRYERVRAIVVDDASEDGSAAVVERWCAERPDRFQAVLNDRRRWKMASFHDAVKSIDAHDVVIELDGDDELISPEAAADLARLHVRADVVWTQHRVDLGPYRGWSHWLSTDMPSWWAALRDPPRLRWSRSFYPGHLRSFKSWMYRLIRPEDLTYDGDWVKVSPDMAYYPPLLEMCPPGLRYFYDRELALYRFTEASEFVASLSTPPGPLHQRHVFEYLAGLDPYPTVDSPLYVGTSAADPTGESVLRAAQAILAEQPSARFVLGTASTDAELEHPRVCNVHLPRRGFVERGYTFEADANGSPDHWQTLARCILFACEGALPAVDPASEVHRRRADLEGLLSNGAGPTREELLRVTEVRPVDGALPLVRAA